MVETYQISTQGVMEGYCKEQVAELLMILFKRNKEEIEPILDSNGYVLKRGINLASALRYKGTLEQRGCKCNVEKLSGPHKLSVDFPDTVMVQIDTDWALVHDSLGNTANGMKVSDPAPLPAQRQLQTEALPAKTEVAEVGRHVVTNEIGTTIQDGPFFVQTPQSICCNCGTKTAISAVATPFVKHLVFSTRFEHEKQIELDLPYCPTCADGIGKYPISTGLQWLIGFGIWLLLFMWLASTYNVAHKPLTMRLLAVVGPLIPALLALRWIGRPKAPMTSKYTPVIIKEYARNPNSTRQEGRAMLPVSVLAQMLGWFYKKLSRHDPDKIKCITMKFSNPAYAKAFRKANKAFVRSGYIKIL